MIQILYDTTTIMYRNNNNNKNNNNNNTFIAAKQTYMHAKHPGNLITISL